MNENENVGFRPDEFHQSLATELAGTSAPPLGDLVTLAAQRGRRQRRWRTLGAVTGSVTAAAVAASLLVGVLDSGPAQRTELTAAATGSPSAAAAPASVPAAATASDQLVADTPAALLDAVVSALPAGLTTDTYSAKLGDPATPNPSVTLNVHSQHGTAVLQVAAYKSQYDFCQPGDWPAGYSYHCSTTAGGEQYEVVSNPAACWQHSLVVLRRHDGVDVAVWMPNCTDAPGVTSPHVPPLTQDQALALAATAAISDRMPAAFVQAADAKYPNLHITK
ncbi:hypothetical protein OG455_12220 [Kitasatospora sp. NBC_01287]|uniref:hypothetical protein n=1 Tax=Kitasatospora sp. NBC_01287 TaxID=2903573 RepID=UPI00225844AD|nr:hypothetical protein [Kitasatospora sp. NBC_01287]MCX4746283.1 hypothetical protein [Kitasatospora sp. NBC_01287]